MPQSPDEERRFLRAWLRQDRRLQAEVNAISVDIELPPDRPYSVGLIRQIADGVENPEVWDGDTDHLERIRSMLAIQTNGFTGQAECEIHGEDIGRLIDAAAENVFGIVPENPESLVYLPLQLEIWISYYLGDHHGLNPYDYQLGVHMTGKGMQVDDYKLNLAFRPVPKIIAS